MEVSDSSAPDAGGASGSAIRGSTQPGSGPDAEVGAGASWGRVAALAAGVGSASEPAGGVPVAESGACAGAGAGVGVGAGSGTGAGSPEGAGSSGGSGAAPPGAGPGGLVGADLSASASGSGTASACDWPAPGGGSSRDSAKAGTVTSAAVSACACRAVDPESEPSFGLAAAGTAQKLKQATTIATAGAIEVRIVVHLQPGSVEASTVAAESDTRG